MHEQITDEDPVLGRADLFTPSGPLSVRGEGGLGTTDPTFPVDRQANDGPVRAQVLDQRIAILVTVCGEVAEAVQVNAQRDHTCAPISAAISSPMRSKASGRQASHGPKANPSARVER